MTDSHEDLPVIVLGAGGHAKVLIDTLLANNRRILGIVAPPSQRRSVLGVNVIGTVMLWPVDNVAGRA